MSQPREPIYTIGHSNRDIDSFIELLRSFSIQTLVDVRAYPTSRRHPHFTAASLQDTLSQAGIGYQWAGRDLGGHRKGKPNSIYAALKSAALRAYADHMQTPPFVSAAAELVTTTIRSRTAVMCAEKQPAQCHRSLLSDYLLMRGASVLHILDAEVAIEHERPLFARVEQGCLIYDEPIQAQLYL
ncbi:MAG: DUF488 family protein [Acidiferrobacterales bacterium]